MGTKKKNTNSLICPIYRDYLNNAIQSLFLNIVVESQIQSISEKSKKVSISVRTEYVLYSVVAIVFTILQRIEVLFIQTRSNECSTSLFRISQLNISMFSCRHSFNISRYFVVKKHLLRPDPTLK